MTVPETRTVNPPATLRPFYEPRSVALVGASRTPGKWGYELAIRLLRSAPQRTVHLVSKSGDPVAGHTTYRSLTDLPAGAELVIAAVPPRDFERVVDAGLAAGTKAFIGVSGGMGELGGPAVQRERALVARIRANGARLLGPNCLGVLDTHSGLTATAWFDQIAERRGSVAVITQSGTVGLDFDLLARRAGIGFSRFVSVGNQADVTVAELLEDLVEHEPTKLVAIYCEEFSTGRRLFEAAAALVRAGKPVLLLAPGASDAAARAAQSHTGSLTSARAVIEAACDAAGVQLLHTTAEVVDTAQLMLRTSRLSGRRIAVVADGGGYGVLISDVLDRTGLEVPPLSTATQEALRAALGESASVLNPIDLAAAAADPAALDRAVEVVVGSREVDGVVITGFIGDPGPADGKPGQVIVSPATARRAAVDGIPIVVQALFEDSPAVTALRDLPVAVYRTANGIEHALKSAVASTQRVSGIPGRVPGRRVSSIEPDYFGARKLLNDAGIPFARSAHATDAPDTVLDVARGMRYPLVLKSTDRLHKSDEGGVLLDIADERTLMRAHEDFVARLGAKSFAVEEMANTKGGVELIIGARRDQQLGPVALVGFGGVFTEVLRDVRLCLAPVSVDTALEMIERLRGARLLSGIRGRPPIDIHSVAVCLARLSNVAAGHPEIAEIEINPLLATPEGALGLDARVIVDPAGGLVRDFVTEEGRSL
jgi:acyl-CoA synthetase (NDP forming)